MRYQRLISLLIIPYAFAKLSVAQHLTDTGAALADDLLRVEYKIFNSKKEIDKNLKSLLKKERNMDLELVNPGEEFNRTDMVIEGLPNKRLIIIGKSSEQIDFILYEHGGNALYNVCLIYKKTKKKHYDIVGLRFNSEINSLEKLRDAIRLKKFVAIN
jgi:hypothetical protein